MTFLVCVRRALFSTNFGYPAFLWAVVVGLLVGCLGSYAVACTIGWGAAMPQAEPGPAALAVPWRGEGPAGLQAVAVSLSAEVDPLEAELYSDEFDTYAQGLRKVSSSGRSDES
jgi:hypothetical protein